ncbi:cell division cycle and apoptosis regulator protein 1 [Tribolium castaneum]|uniref:Cell division cycle and apoptosis regulator protein 1 n=1 Tax=Tribolium castaneum TaxID=7070 RepID=D6WB55_TRICA|nr:PREDICTED: cell division cycle and apoptosis regulator protein 1 [Tribolium castaneum]EEZ98940.2 hypothetical protein TcasGA2_TC004563 [Tribolium castaneum]|eukprot:XP_008200817.1 PREDICTED: cell division cycle and apoptosis regulator protein 1 [Tribolium castaneum]
MSNMGQFNNKNPPWGRANNSPNIVNQPSPLQQQIMNQSALNNMNTSGMVQFQQQHQQQVFQNAMGLQQQNLGLGLQQMANNAMGAGLGSQLASNQIFQQVGAVTYPNPRGLNPTAFQTQNISAVPPVQNNSNVGTKQRVFTGTVTKVHDNFGFVDEDVFFQINACVKGSNPTVGDRVLVEASYNPTMPFKWNATRIQVLPMSNQPSNRHSNNSKNYNNSNANTYNAVPPPNDNSNGNFGRNQRPKAVMGRGRERSRDRERDDDEIERKRRREERMREREKEEKKSPLRRRSRSPKSRRRSRIVPRYMVQIPKIALDLSEADVLEIRRRYANLYIPSDFFYTHFRWVDAFPPDKPFTMNKPSFFHIMNKEVDPVVENDAVLEPPDADYLFSAKVMLMSMSGLDELYQKCCAMAEDKDKRDRESEERDFVHPARLLNFLVGLRGKNETMAIGGPWSPSLDGENPDKDPSVLIKTAIRTCKALTGIDLSSCTQWYRFVELYYRRSESTHKGRAVPARVETVVLFLPDVWSCVPTRLEWDGLHQSYRKQLERRLKADLEIGGGGGGSGSGGGDDTPPADEKEEEPPSDKLEPTHYSQLDPKTMVVSALRNELKARNINSKGLKSQLVARLAKALKVEAEKAEDPTKEIQTEVDYDISADEKKIEAEEKKLDEKEKALLEKRYTLPEQQHILVHPSRTAKSGKFDCTIMSLSLLLDYRPEDTKEHSFEVSLFAELFNEMLMRDFGFNIYRALYELPDKIKDEKKKRDDEKKSDDKNKKEDEKKKDEEKSEESEKKKKDDKKSDDSEEDEEYDDEEGKDKKKDKEKKKKERVKMFTKDKHLLLSFIYFDQTHCGYIFDKDIEDLLYTLGLNLSRAQVRKLVGKVVTRDSLHYRKLTDKPKDNNEFIVIDDLEKETNLHDLAVGNKKLLPVFVGEVKVNGSENEEAPNPDDGLVTYRGALVDVGKLMSQLERSEKARLETESRMVSLKNENNKLSDKYNKSNSTIKYLNSDLKEYKEKLRTTEDALSRITAYSKLYQTTLLDIRDKIDPVLKSTSNSSKEEVAVKKDCEKDKKHDESKTRWEKEVKQEEVQEVEPVEAKKEA